MFYKLFFVVFTSILVASNSSAAEFYVTSESPFSSGSYDEDKLSIVISGEIKDGDYERFIKYIRTQPKGLFTLENNHKLQFLQLTSPGGSVLEAFKFVDFIKKAYIPVVVPIGKQCASSCFLMYVASPIRYPAIGKLGIHRAYISNKEKSLSAKEFKKHQQSVNNQIKTYLKEMNVSEQIVEKMMNNSSKEIYLLNVNEQQAIGEYQQWFEEYLISKCDLNTNLMDAFWKSAEPTKEAYRHFSKIQYCRLNVTLRERLFFPLEEMVRVIKPEAYKEMQEKGSLEF